MKKFIYIFGVVIINIFMFGALFKPMHWPGASILIVLALGLFSIVFLPMAFIQSYKDNGKKYKSLYIAGFICCFITFIGAMFKIQHWPGAAWFLMIGIPLPFIYFLPLYVYHHNKSKEKSMLNLLGVMFMMVYVALFTSILALNVSRNVLEAFNTGGNDIVRTNEILALKNQQLYEAIGKSDVTEQLKAKSNAICEQINEIKVSLVKASGNSDSETLESDSKINLSAIHAKDETSRTIKIMRGGDGMSGRAADLKEEIIKYREFLKSIASDNEKLIEEIDELLSTSDIEEMRYGEKMTISWENDFFPYGAFLISIIGNLDCIASNVKMAEGETLSYLAGK